MEQNLATSLAKKFRIMTFSLIFSGALNIGLIATCFVRQDNFQSFAFEGALQKSTGESTVSNLSALNAMSKLSFRELVSLLTNRELVEEGYSKRDLALAALVTFRHFNLEKALGASPAQKRSVTVQSGPVELYPGLGEEQFEAIIRFAYREKWPLMAKGLFELLQKVPSPREESLCQAFAMTSEFSALQLLFQKTEASQDVLTLIDLATEGTWDLLNGFAKEQAQLLDLSMEKRRRFLLSYLAQRSKTAVKLLLSTDLEFSFKRLDDRGICDMLTLLQGNFEESQKFCAALLVSPRSDFVRKMAAEKLYAFAGETIPASFDVQAAIARFCPGLKVVNPPAPVPVVPEAPVAAAPVSPPASSSKSVCYHTVAEGETLWKIARHYKVKVEDLVQVNGIENGKLYPGMTIQVP